MLKTRILTAIILIPLVVLGTLWLPYKAFAWVSGFIFLGGLWEWTALSGFQSTLSRVISFILIPVGTLLLLIILEWLSHWLKLGKSVFREGIPVFILMFWLIATFGVVYFPKFSSFWKSRSVSIIAGCMVLIPAWFMLVALQYLNPGLALYVFCLVWVADIAAYFAGKHFGKHQLAPELSPGKTWEGVLGAFIGGFIVILLGYRLLDQNLSLLSWSVLGLMTITFSIIGDLFESLFKRLHHLKDSGALLPGHGGLLDRIDSITAAVPIFTIGSMFFN